MALLRIAWVTIHIAGSNFTHLSVNEFNHWKVPKLYMVSLLSKNHDLYWMIGGGTMGYPPTIKKPQKLLRAHKEFRMVRLPVVRLRSPLLSS